MQKFSELGLSPELLRAIESAGYQTPTPIQAQAIPVALRGEDVLGCARTGTGKTAAFLLPILERLGRPGAGPRPLGPRALILTPTRELCVQVAESARTYAGKLPLRSTAIYGGVGMVPQTNELRRGVDIVIATPGRLLDHLRQRHVTFQALEVLVLDEADRMLDMGFLPDVKRILATLPAKRQNLFFSATMPSEIEDLVGRTMRQPVVVEATPRSTTVQAVRQVVYAVDGERKRDLLSHLLARGDMGRVLVFTRTKVRADRVAKHLGREGRQVAAIHGNKSQGARTRALDGFKSGKIPVLVATDIAARGIDVDNISHVVNFDLPHVPEDYVHRIGRTGRAGASGEAMSLVSADEASQMRAIERLIGRVIPRENVPGFDHNARPTPEPPSARHAPAAHRHAAPAHRHAASAPRHAAPAPRHAAPVARHAAPAPRHAAPVARHAAPVARHAAPVARHAAPAPRHPAPAHRHGAAASAAAPRHGAAVGPFERPRHGSATPPAHQRRAAGGHRPGGGPGSRGRG